VERFSSSFSEARGFALRTCAWPQRRGLKEGNSKGLWRGATILSRTKPPSGFGAQRSDEERHAPTPRPVSFCSTYNTKEYDRSTILLRWATEELAYQRYYATTVWGTAQGL
jgi:hypothetical protein